MGYLFEAVRDLMRPTDWEKRAFCVDLLDRELRRAQTAIDSAHLDLNPPRIYRRDISSAEWQLLHARIYFFLSHDYYRLPYHWLILLGYRLAVERGLPSGGFDALKVVVCETLGRSEAEVVHWTVDLYFHQFTTPELRREWDYPGKHFRMTKAG